MNATEQEDVRQLMQRYGATELLRFIGQVMGEAAIPQCSFCGLSRDQVKHMMAVGCGQPFGFICSECIDLCNQLMAKA